MKNLKIKIKKHSKSETLFANIHNAFISKVALFFVNFTNFKPYHISFLGLFLNNCILFIYSGNHYFAVASFIFAMM